MCTSAQLNDVSSRVVEIYKRVFGDSIIRIVIYGSYARGNFDDQSDVDFAAIVKGDRMELQEKLKTVWEESALIGVDNDVVVSPTVIPYEEFERYKEKLPYYRNIAQEGMVVG